jgi:LysM repeat protein
LGLTIASVILAACGTGGPTSAERPEDDALDPTLVVATPTPVAAPTPATTDYTIVAGDTLGGIATSFGVSIDELLEVNGMTIDTVLNVGEVMRIPIPVVAETLPADDSATGTDRVLTTYTVAVGDTLGTIADRFDTSIDELLELNTGLDVTTVLAVGDMLEVPVPSASAPETAPEGPVPAPGSNRLELDEYVVVSGDTVGGIADRFGLTIGELLEANNLTTDSVLQVGQVLTIPEL